MFIKRIIASEAKTFILKSGHCRIDQSRYFEYIRLLFYLNIGPLPRVSTEDWCGMPEGRKGKRNPLLKLTRSLNGLDMVQDITDTVPTVLMDTTVIQGLWTLGLEVILV